MDRSLDGYLAASVPGPWQDALKALSNARGAARGLRERHRREYDAYYGTPESIRPHLDPSYAEAVRLVEDAGVASAAAMDRVHEARDLALVEEAGRLGTLPRREGEPDWVRLLRDLHALREWRVAHVDGVDVHLPPFLLRPKEKGPAPLFEKVLKAWAKGAGVQAKDVVDRLWELGRAGLVPGVTDSPEPTAYVLWSPDPDADFGRLVENEDSAALLTEVEAAAGALPEASFPVPRDRMDALAALAGPRPA